jgi:hypothetical protein
MTISKRRFQVFTSNVTYSGGFTTPPAVRTVISESMYNNIGSIGNEGGKYSRRQVEKESLPDGTEIFQLLPSLQFLLIFASGTW